MRSPTLTRTRGLYAILDVDAWKTRGVDLSGRGVVEAIGDALLAAQPTMLQLRAKSTAPHETLSLLRRLSPRAHAADVPLVANDRVDLALLAGTSAIHVGQDDLPLADVRRLAPEMLVGVSTHSLAQLEAALAEGPSYVAFGPIFVTTSKALADPTVGLEVLAEAQKMADSARVPLVAIGGVTRARAAELVAVGTRHAAVISDLVVVDDERLPSLPYITTAARALAAALGESAN